MSTTPSLWWADHGQVPPGDGWLGPREREVQQRLSVPKRRADWRLGRFAAKHAVLTGAAPARWRGDLSAPIALAAPEHLLAAVELLPADDGAPEVHADGEPVEVGLSWSHRAGRVVVAAAPAGTTVGVDLEVLEPRSAAFVHEWFDEREQAWVGDDHVGRANLLWTAKEAAAKVHRAGLRLDVRSLVVEAPEGPPEPGGPWVPISVAGPAGRPSPATADPSSVVPGAAPSVGPAAIGSPPVPAELPGGPGGALSGWAALVGGFVVTLLTDPPAPAPTGPGAWVIAAS